MRITCDPPGRSAAKSPATSRPPEPATIIPQAGPAKGAKDCRKKCPDAPRPALNRSFIHHALHQSLIYPLYPYPASIYPPFLNHALDQSCIRLRQTAPRGYSRTTHPGQRAGGRPRLKLPGAGWCRATIAKITRPPPNTISPAQNHSVTTRVVNTFAHQNPSQ